MSRLDSMIRRLVAHRKVLDWARERLADAPGDILECGLGNGRTFDHLRQNFPDRSVLVVERDPSPHPDCWPEPDELLQGEATEVLNDLRESHRHFALINYDLGTGDADFSRSEAAALAPAMADLLRPGGLLVSVQPLPDLPVWQAIPPDVTGGGDRVQVYRKH